jgi:serine/threonine protein kinase
LENVILWSYKRGAHTIYEPVIIDYGQAQLIPADPLNSSLKCLVTSEKRGKGYYHPLETMAENIRPTDAFACDMWQMGILLLIMISGKPPFIVSMDESSQKIDALKYEFYRNVRFENYRAIFKACSCFNSSIIYPEIFNIFKQLVKKVAFPPEEGVRATALTTLRMCLAYFEQFKSTC